MMGHLYEPPPLATRLAPGLPPAVDQIFARVLAKNAAERYNTCREFTDAVANSLVPGRNSAPTSTSPSYPVQAYDPRPPTDPRAPVTGPYGPDPRITNSGPGDLSELLSSPKSQRRWLIPAAVGVVVVAVAAGIGIWVSQSGGSQPAGTTASTTTAAAAAGAPTSVAQAKQQNPAFAGKTVTMVDVLAGGKVSIYLGGTPQTDFLQGLGFVYNLSYVKQGTEPSPRPMTDYDSINAADDSYILAVRSDPGAGGGLLGLPYEITDSRATVIPLDDPSAVAAMRNWGTDSEKAELATLVPVLHNRIQ